MSHTPPSFRFHFKVFGLFTRLTADLATVPGSVRSLAKATGGVVHLRSQSAEFKSALWAAQNRVLELLHSNGRLGQVVFQFAEKLEPNDRGREHIAWCRQQLFAPALMAVELRNLAWTKDEAEIQRTVDFLRGIPAVFIATDNLEGELLNEFVPKARVPLPIHLRLSCGDALYIRIHRRQGSARVLSHEEIDAWVQRLHHIRDITDASGTPLRGPIFWMIGTDHEDQPVINAKKMQAALEAEDQRRRQQYEAKQKAGSTEAASCSSAAATASSSSVASPTALSADSASRSPEPLAFDYRSYYHRHLARLSCSVIGVSDSVHQTSLGAFFGRTSAAEARAQMLQQEEQQQAEDEDDGGTEEKKLQGSMMQFVSVARSAPAAASSVARLNASTAAAASTSPAAPSHAAAASSSVAAVPTPAAASAASPATFADDSVDDLEVLSSHVVTSPTSQTDAAAASASPAAAVGLKKKAPSSHSSLSSPAASPAKKSKKQANEAAAAAAAAANTKPIASFFKKG